jgi:hypothetical protein
MVEVRLDRSLRNVQVAGDFRVIASLQKQIYDLTFAWP